MKCSACRERLPAYQDGVLAVGAAADLEAHLRSCLGCRTFAEEMMVLEQRLARMREIGGPIFVNRYNLSTAASITGTLRPGSPASSRTTRAIGEPRMRPTCESSRFSDRMTAAP